MMPAYHQYKTVLHQGCCELIEYRPSTRQRVKETIELQRCSRWQLLLCSAVQHSLLLAQPRCSPLKLESSLSGANASPISGFK
jgi:hypothetical protein